MATSACNVCSEQCEVKIRCHRKPAGGFFYRIGSHLEITTVLACISKVTSSSPGIVTLKECALSVGGAHCREHEMLCR